ncbi:hypothetical protein [Streptomyces sp. NPDC088707]|uniref:hypothetical protein n=1 Tax=Streptomyces sp. NPDC088707 TaxID=3365871 RepID=UPI003805B1F2
MAAGLPVAATLPVGLTITHRSRFVLSRNASAPMQAWTVVGRVLPLMLNRSGESAQRTVRQVQACVTELVEFASSRTVEDSVLGEVWLDQQHVFVSVEHTQPPFVGSRHSMGAVGNISDEHGTHEAQNAYQTWAAIRID